MSAILGNLIVIAVLATAVALAVRSVWREHKQGGGCSGNCSCCGNCSKSVHTAPDDRT